MLIVEEQLIPLRLQAQSYDHHPIAAGVYSHVSLAKGTMTNLHRPERP